MKNNYTIIFICSFLAAGLVCLVTGLIVYLTSSSGSAIKILIGITVTVVGAADAFISLIALLAAIIKNRITSKNTRQNNNTEDKKD